MRKKKLDEDLQLYQTPLELKLKHSTVHVDELCPLIVPNPGVAVIHDYADWVKEASGDLLEAQSEYGSCFCLMFLERVGACVHRRMNFSAPV